jgi:hypothetical protein
VRIGLAIPSTEEYQFFLQPDAIEKIRRDLELWVLLYDQDSSVVYEIAPNQDIFEPKETAASAPGA